MALDQVALYRGYLGTKRSMYYVEFYCYKNCSTVKLYRTQKMAANQVNLDQVAYYRGYLGTKSSMYYVEIYCYKNCSMVKLYRIQQARSQDFFTGGGGLRSEKSGPQLSAGGCEGAPRTPFLTKKWTSAICGRTPRTPLSTGLHKKWQRIR